MSSEIIWLSFQTKRDLDGQSFLQPKILEFETESDFHYTCGIFNFDTLKLLEFENNKLSHSSNFETMNHWKNICKCKIEIRTLVFLQGILNWKM